MRLKHCFLALQNMVTRSNWFKGFLGLTLLFLFLLSSCYYGDDGMGCRRAHGKYERIYTNSILDGSGHFYNWYRIEFHEIAPDSAVTVIRTYKEEFNDFYVEGPSDVSWDDCLSLYHSGYEKSADSAEKLVIEYFWHGYNTETEVKDEYEVRLKHHVLGEVSFTYPNRQMEYGDFDTIEVDSMQVIIDYLGFSKLKSNQHEMALVRVY